MDGAYLVGKVVEVNYLSSRVLLLSDLNSKIPVIVEPNTVFSILSGTGKDYGIIQYSKKYDDLKLLAFAKRYEKIFNFSKIKPKLSN